MAVSGSGGEKGKLGQDKENENDTMKNRTVWIFEPSIEESETKMSEFGFMFPLENKRRCETIVVEYDDLEELQRSSLRATEATQDSQDSRARVQNAPDVAPQEMQQQDGTRHVVAEEADAKVPPSNE